MPGSDGPPAAVAVLLATAVAAAASDLPQVLDVDLAQISAVFQYDGHGGLADAGSSRLLMDYREPQRSQILDYLFLPSFGASLHMLKVEIAGDTQSTDGTGPSHMHHRHDHDGCFRGNAAWLIREAKARNPDIATYGLPWGMPAWVGGGDYWSDDSITYLVKWLECMQTAANGTIVDYLGLWNEPHWRGDTWGGANYTKSLRKALDSAGFVATHIVAFDDAPQMSGAGGLDPTLLSAWATDAEFRKAVDVLGYHYCCPSFGEPGYQALAEYKPTVKVWQSEDHSSAWATTLVSDFVGMNQTSAIAWALIWSAPYPDFVDGGSGIFFAFEPWSGHYTLEPQGANQQSALWTVAHWTQFSQIGWRYLDGGASGNLTGGGSYLTLVSDENATDWTMLLQTSGRASCPVAGESPPPITAVQNVTIALKGGFCPRGCSLQLWHSNITSHFQRVPGEITVPPPAAAVQGTQSVQLSLASGSIYTLSTITTAKKGSHGVAPPRTAFPLPFSQGFEGLANDTLAPYMCDQSGSFSIEAGSGKGPSGGGGNAMKQRVTRDPTIGYVLSSGSFLHFATFLDLFSHDLSSRLCC